MTMGTPGEFGHNRIRTQSRDATIGIDPVTQGFGDPSLVLWEAGVYNRIR